MKTTSGNGATSGGAQKLVNEVVSARKEKKMLDKSLIKRRKRKRKKKKKEKRKSKKKVEKERERNKERRTFKTYEGTNPVFPPTFPTHQFSESFDKTITLAPSSKDNSSSCTAA